MFFYYEADSGDGSPLANLSDAVSISGTLYGVGLSPGSGPRINNVDSNYVNSWTAQSSPTPTDQWRNIWVGHQVAFLRNNSNEFYVWGNNTYGELGFGDTTYRGTPTLFTGSQVFTDMDGGDDHSVAVDASGQLWATGRNNYGQLGLGDTTNRSSWTQITSAVDSNGNTISLPTISKVFCGANHTLVLTTGGDVYSCGQGNNYLLGYSPTPTSNVTTLKYVTSGISKLSVSGRLAIGIKTDGTLVRWGYQNSWTPGSQTPTALGAASDWTLVAAAYGGFAAVNSSNELYFVGTNNAGEFGGVCSVGTKVDSLTKLTSWSGGTISDIKFTGLSTNNDSCFIRTSDKKLYVSGENSYKQLGLGTSTDTNVFAESATGVLDMIPASGHAWIIKE